jgi:SPP1 family predicted phage head-tail adaptor
MSAGQLDQRITFQANTATPDGMGGNTKAWANFATTPTVWAGVKAGRGNEGMDEGGTVASGLWLFTIRYRADVNEVDRLLWRGEPYNIRNVKRTSQRDLLVVIEAERGVAT